MLRHEQTRTSLPSVCSLSLARRFALEAASWSCYVITLVNPGRRVRCAFCTAGDRPIALASEGAPQNKHVVRAWSVHSAVVTCVARATCVRVSLVIVARVAFSSPCWLALVSARALTRTSQYVGRSVCACSGVSGGGITSTLATRPSPFFTPQPHFQRVPQVSALSEVGKGAVSQLVPHPIYIDTVRDYCC